jgi:hypothetical protein
VFIRIADRAPADISVHELDVLDRFHVELGVSVAAADEVLRAAGLGEILGAHAWIWPDKLLLLVRVPLPPDLAGPIRGDARLGAGDGFHRRKQVAAARPPEADSWGEARIEALAGRIGDPTMLGQLAP